MMQVNNAAGLNAVSKALAQFAECGSATLHEVFVGSEVHHLTELAEGVLLSLGYEVSSELGTNGLTGERWGSIVAVNG